GGDDLGVVERDLGQARGHRVARDELDEGERHRRDAEQERERDEDAAREVTEERAAARTDPDGRAGLRSARGRHGRAAPGTSGLDLTGVALARGDTACHCRPTARRSTCQPAGEYSVFVSDSVATTTPEL